MWDDLPEFGEMVVSSYRRNIWQDQDRYIEAWLEKDALSGIFEAVLNDYGVTLNVGRGYDGWSSLHRAAQRIASNEDQCSPVSAILYFGDFDPSGEDMVCSLRKRLGFFRCEPEIIKCALTADDIEKYHLPPDFAKRSDTRAAKFIAKHGDVSVELDALPVDVLESRLRDEVELRMDLDALAETKATQERERTELAEAIEKIAG